MSAVLGIDPGAAQTGMVVRDGNDLLAHLVVQNTHPAPDRGVGVGIAYLTEVTDVATRLLADHGAKTVAVEGVVRPNPHVNRRNGNAVIDPGPIIGTGIVLGHLTGRLGLAATTVWVPPGRNGSMPLLAYPDELVTDAERRHGTNRVGGSSPLRHARSAWDVAGAGTLLVRASLRARNRGR